MSHPDMLIIVRPSSTGAPREARWMAIEEEYDGPPMSVGLGASPDSAARDLLERLDRNPDTPHTLRVEQ